MIGFGQNVNIPDANFKAYLVGNSLINTNGDSEIQVSEANACNDINCYNNNISDLTGIEYFTSLITLDCRQNQLTSLDVSNNTSLTHLQCGYTQLTSLNVSSNTALIELHFGSAQITNIDLSNNTALIELTCSRNQLTSLDVSQNTSLTLLECDSNQLTTVNVNNGVLERVYIEDNFLECLDISNTNLEYLYCSNNVLSQLNTKNGSWINMYVDATVNSLTCVEVDNIGYASSNWDFDSFTTLSTNCNYTNPCNSTSSIIEQNTNKKLININLLGKGTIGSYNEILFNIYDDGTVEKRIVIE